MAQFEKDKEVFDLLSKKDVDIDISVVFVEEKMVVGFKERGKRFGQSYYDKKMVSGDVVRTEYILLLMDENGEIEERPMFDDEITASGDFRTFRVARIKEKNTMIEHGEIDPNNPFAGLQNRDNGEVISNKQVVIVPRYSYFIDYKGLEVGLPDYIVNYKKGVSYATPDGTDKTSSGEVIITKPAKTGLASMPKASQPSPEVKPEQNQAQNVNPLDMLDNKDPEDEDAGELIIKKAEVKGQKPAKAPAKNNK